MKLYPLQRHHLLIALAIGLLAVIIRVVFIFSYSTSPLAGHDPQAYWSFAQGIAAGQGFRSTFEPWLADRPPLYSYFLAGLILIFGENRAAVFVVQAAIGAVAVALFYLSITRVLGQKRGFIAGLLFTFFPPFLLFTQQILTEALYLPLLVALLAVLILPEKINRGGYGIFIGILVGLLALLRREAILPAGLIVLAVLYLRIQSKRRNLIMFVLLIVLATGLTLAPWLIRNWQVLGRPLLSSSGGWNFLVGNNPDADGGYTPPPPEWAAQFAGLSELKRNEKAWELSLSWIRNHPGEFLQLVPKKLVTLWGLPNNVVLDITDLTLGCLSLIGLARLVQRRDGWQFVTIITLLLIVSVTLTGLIFVGGWRYRFAAYPGLILLAAYSLPDRWVELCLPVNLR